MFYLTWSVCFIDTQMNDDWSGLTFGGGTPVAMQELMAHHDS